MKKILTPLTAVFAFFVAVPAFAAEPPDKCIPPKTPHSFCIRFSNPVGGVDAPAVTCQTDPTKRKNYPFKLIVSSTSNAPTDYIPEDLWKACSNACIEQYKLCQVKPGTKKADCQSQISECKALHSASAAFLKSMKRACSPESSPPQPHKCSPRRNPSMYVPAPGQESGDIRYF